MLNRVVRLAAGTLLFALVASPAFAQATVRVTVEQANIWRFNFLTVLTVVRQGTVLEVVSRRGEWLEVVVPRAGADLQTGLIALRQVAVVQGPLPNDLGTGAAPSSVPGQRPPALTIRPDTGLRGFGDASFQWFFARDSFNAIFDRTWGNFFGGGAEYRFGNGVFGQGAIRWFRDTGERVVVADNEVFPLGVPDTVTIVPISFTIGYRYPSRQYSTYVGAGAGTYLYKETSEFSESADDLDEKFVSYHMLFGVEWRGHSFIGIAGEVQITFVPSSLTGPVAEAFEEKDLGGVEARIKVVFGK
jgi:Outer membrane protein beta-barrel domain